jgi:hypothetical protein
VPPAMGKRLSTLNMGKEYDENIFISTDIPSLKPCFQKIYIIIFNPVNPKIL